MQLYARILRYLKPHGAVVATALAAIVVYSVLNAFSFVLLIPFLREIFGSEGAGTGAGGDTLDGILDATLGRFVDTGGPPQEAILGIIVFILVVFALKNVFFFIREYLVAWIQQAVTRDLRDEVYDHLLELDLAFFGRTRMGQIISRLTHDVEQLRALLTRELALLTSSFFEVLAAVVAMLLISVKLTLAAFIVVPGTMIVWGPLLKRLRRGDRRVLDLAGDVNSHIQETLAGIRMVKSSSAEEHEKERFHGLTRSYFKTYVRTARLRALAQPITEMLAAVGTVILLWYGAHLVLTAGEIRGEEFISFLGLSMLLYSPVKYISKFPAVVQPGLVGAERVFEFLDAPIEITDEPGARPFPGLEEAIAYEDVSFAYRPGELVLKDVSFTVPVGSVVALVGPSGAGKTTVVDLLARFYDVTSGRVTIDGTDIREFSIKSLRGSLGIVSQETVLFHDTIRSNVAYGMEGVPEEEVERVARAANAHGFITRLPRGYDTVVGERGTELSGGQRQRIAIARALLRDPPILIFDEATSALDTESERLVQQAIEHLLEGRTVFVIAHRLSTVQRADRILVLDEGRVVERGTHDELMTMGGLYRRLYELQFRDPPGGGTGAPPAGGGGSRSGGVAANAVVGRGREEAEPAGGRGAPVAEAPLDGAGGREAGRSS